MKIFKYPIIGPYTPLRTPRRTCRYLSGPEILEVRNYLPQYIWSPPRGITCTFLLEFKALASRGVPRNLYENYLPETRNTPVYNSVYHGQPRCTRNLHTHYAPAGHKSCPGKVQRKVHEDQIIPYTLRTAPGAEQRAFGQR